MRARIAILMVCLVLLIIVPALGQSFPTVSDEYEITDTGHWTIGYPQFENSVMTRIGNDLYFVYRATTDPSGDDPEYQIWVRRFSLDTFEFDDAVAVSDEDEFGNALVTGIRLDPYGELTTPNVHDEPSLLRDVDGNLHVFWDWEDPGIGQRAESNSGTYTIPPRWRMIPDLDRPGTWGDAGGIPSRVLNNATNFPSKPEFFDLSAVFDDRAGMTYFVGEGAAFQPGLDFQYDDDGLPRVFFRIGGGQGPEDRFDGPYILVQAASHQPPEFTHVVGGNVFTKGDLVLGKETTGPRSLHLFWNIRNTFQDPVGETWHRFNYGLLYARSYDGGDTWYNLQSSGEDETLTYLFKEGLQQDPILEQDPADPVHLRWNDEWQLGVQMGYREIEDDIYQGGERSFDVDSQSHPVIVYLRYAGTDEPYKDLHIDQEGAELPVDDVWDLVLKRWTGTGWEEHVVETDSIAINTRVRVDMEDNIWIFVGNTGVAQKARYNKSSDGGATWTGWTALETKDRAWRLHTYIDPIDPNYHYLAYDNKYDTVISPCKMYFIRLQLTKKLLVNIDPQPGCFAVGQHGSLDVILSTISEGATIYYTLDGSDPTVESEEYSGSITLDPRTPPYTVKAVAVQEGWTDSKIIEGEYDVKTNPNQCH